jgi:putative methionine-R-sulfoxide reductase with GAF domain
VSNIFSRESVDEISSFGKMEENFYDELLKVAISLMEGERDYMANCANISSLIFHQLNDLGTFVYFFWVVDQRRTKK